MKERPNIIVFMTDQQNASTWDVDSKAIIPHTRRFLESSVNFTHAYTPAPHCCPSRASFLSGLYPAEHGVWHNVEVCNAISRGLFDGIKLFPEVLKEHGYRTFFSGKWHVSAYEGPEDRGFDTVLREHIMNYGRMSRENVPHFEDWDNFYSGKVRIDGASEEKTFGRIIREGYPTYHQFGVDQDPFKDSITVEVACDAIDNYSDDDPFFMYIGTTGPHDPYCVPQEFIDMYQGVDIELPANFYDEMTDKPALYRRTKEQFSLSEEEHKESIRHYLAFCSFEDSLFGKVLEAVERKKIKKDTVVIYLTDHGDYMGAHGLWAKGLPCFEEAYRICAAIHLPGMDRPRQENSFVSISDFAPTILELAGIPDGLRCSGKSLIPLIQGAKPASWRTEMYTQTNGNEIYGIQRAVWNTHWKYVYNSFDYDELYFLDDDPGEMTNLIERDEYSAVVKELCIKMWEFARETRDAITCPYIMVGLAPYGPGILLPPSG